MLATVLATSGLAVRVPVNVVNSDSTTASAATIRTCTPRMHAGSFILIPTSRCFRSVS